MGGEDVLSLRLRRASLPPCSNQTVNNEPMRVCHDRACNTDNREPKTFNLLACSYILVSVCVGVGSVTSCL